MKNTSITRGLIFGFFTLIFLLNTTPAQACASCWGDTSGSKMGNAVALGIALMVVLMFAMLGTLIGFGYYLKWRAEHPLPDYSDLLNDDHDDLGK